MEHGRFGWWGVVDGGVSNEQWIMVVVNGFVCSSRVNYGGGKF